MDATDRDAKDRDAKDRDATDRDAQFERKYRDPNGVVIDVTSKEHVTASWRVPTE